MGCPACITIDNENPLVFKCSCQYNKLNISVTISEKVDPDLKDSNEEMEMEKLLESSDNDNSMGILKTKESLSPMMKLCICVLGMTLSFTCNGLLLEKFCTRKKEMTNQVNELTLTFTFCMFYTAFAQVFQWMRTQNKVVLKTKKNPVPLQILILIAVTAFGSTITSICALRYVNFITRILGKSCKTIPVMLMGMLLGKRYPVRKYVSIVLLCSGVAIFMLGGHSASTSAAPAVAASAATDRSDAVWGSLLLLLSLLFDGATGALEDKYMAEYELGAFELMYHLNKWKAILSFIGMLVMNQVNEHTLSLLLHQAPSLLALSVSGAFGQAFIFYTIEQFGALTSSVIGTCRKVVSITMSVILFGHVLYNTQIVGIVIVFCALLMNSVRSSRIIPCRRLHPIPKFKRKTSDLTKQMELQESKLQDQDQLPLLLRVEEEILIQIPMEA